MSSRCCGIRRAFDGALSRRAAPAGLLDAGSPPPACEMTLPSLCPRCPPSLWSHPSRRCLQTCRAVFLKPDGVVLSSTQSARGTVSQEAVHPPCQQAAQPRGVSISSPPAPRLRDPGPAHTRHSACWRHPPVAAAIPRKPCQKSGRRFLTRHPSRRALFFTRLRAPAFVCVLRSPVSPNFREPALGCLRGTVPTPWFCASTGQVVSPCSVDEPSPASQPN